MARTALSDVRGPLNSLMDSLSGEHGAEWLERLKRLQRGELVVKHFPVWIGMRLQAWVDSADIDQAIKDAGMFYLYEWLSRTVRLAMSQIYVRGEYVDLVVLKLSEMGFNSYVSIRDILDQAEAFGLEKCPAMLAVSIRLGWSNQPAGDAVYIGMEPVVSGLHTNAGLREDNEPDCVLSVANWAGKLYLGVQYEASENRPIFSPSDRFVFIKSCK